MLISGAVVIYLMLRMILTILRVQTIVFYLRFNLDFHIVKHAHIQILRLRELIRGKKRRTGLIQTI